MFTPKTEQFALRYLPRGFFYNFLLSAFRMSGAFALIYYFLHGSTCVRSTAFEERAIKDTTMDAKAIVVDNNMERCS